MGDALGGGSARIRRHDECVFAVHGWPRVARGEVSFDVRRLSDSVGLAASATPILDIAWVADTADTADVMVSDLA